ncbi:MAG: DUF4097 domain-containing protein [candidate division Zixibacteria bacterium]|nr:DUF4097 domain-containing protein [candidate division Zixibacteria bacterium]
MLKKSNHRRSLQRLICLCLLAAVGPVSPALAEEFTFDYQKMVDLERPVRLSLEVLKGKILVAGTDADRLVIEASKIVRASNRREAEEVADHIEIKVTDSREAVTVKTNYLTMLNRSQSFWQKVLGGGSSDLVQVVYRITLPYGCSLDVKSMTADIELANVEGEVTIENGSGSTRGEFVYGPVTLHQPNGDIDLRWVEGDIRIKSTSGRIYINQVRGAIDLSTQAGDVTIQTELDSPRDYFVETASGRINFMIPSSASGGITIETGTGEIKSQMPIAIESMTRRKVVGKFGIGGPDVTLSSMSGDVIVELY